MATGVHPLFRRPQAAWWTLGVGLAATVAVGWELHREAVAMDRQRLARRAAEITAQLDARIEKSEMLLHNLRDYLTLSREDRNAVFERWCYENGLTINCPWIHGILVATNRPLVSWPEGVPRTFRVWTTNEVDAFRALAMTQRVVCDIALRSRLTNTKQFLAEYDLAGSVREPKWFSRIIGNSRLGMSEHGAVMRDARGNAIEGTCFQVPVYQPQVTELVADLTAAGFTNHSHRSPLRWLHLSAVIVAPVDFGELAQSIWGGAAADVGVELFSSTNPTAATWLNRSGPMPRAADPGFRPYLALRQVWPMYGQKFSIYFHTLPLFEAQSPRRLVGTAVGAGTVMTLLATALVGVVTRARNQQERMTEQIREARDALAAAEAERNKISRDLHDGTIQALYAIELGLERTAGQVASDPATVGRELWAARRELDAVIADIRRFITAETRTEGAVDFCAVLHSLVRRAPTGGAVRIALQCDAAVAQGLCGEAAVQLANIAREALSNSLRHGRPREVRIGLRSDSDGLVLEIADDGCGFDPQAPPRTGVGLASMASRAREIGAAWVLQSTPSRGTCVAVRLPVRVPEAEGGTRSPQDGTA